MVSLRSWMMQLAPLPPLREELFASSTPDLSFSIFQARAAPKASWTPLLSQPGTHSDAPLIGRLAYSARIFSGSPQEKLPTSMLVMSFSSLSRPFQAPLLHMCRRQQAQLAMITAMQILTLMPPTSRTSRLAPLDLHKKVAIEPTLGALTLMLLTHRHRVSHSMSMQVWLRIFIRAGLPGHLGPSSPLPQPETPSMSPPVGADTRTAYPGISCVWRVFTTTTPVLRAACLSPLPLLGLRPALRFFPPALAVCSLRSSLLSAHRPTPYPSLQIFAVSHVRQGEAEPNLHRLSFLFPQSVLDGRRVFFCAPSLSARPLRRTFMIPGYTAHPYLLPLRLVLFPRNCQPRFMVQLTAPLRFLQCLHTFLLSGLFPHPAGAVHTSLSDRPNRPALDSAVCSPESSPPDLGPPRPSRSRLFRVGLHGSHLD